MTTPTDDPNPSTGALEEPADAPSGEKRVGWFKRTKRAWLGKMVSNLVGENPPPAGNVGQESDSAAPSPASIRNEIEESGLFGGISNRIKRTADQYLQQKMDEIEARIDRKLNEIDARLSEWRDREIANRIRILKITLWVSVIVAVVSLIYAWVKDYVLTT
ncbi:MAG TPA: hypothetical protein VL992_05700 [Tepidisphaeraceae bacterium]|nr:hypothetical protein [Tepidisphaeraceae bacterium]HUB24904.1 hypothetical protein [Tepidisphaeraceae bacterium]